MESAPAGVGAGRAAALAWAGLKLAAVVLLAAGVEVGYLDGDEFDDVGCTVAQQPGGTSHGARSAQARERAGGKVPGSDGGSAGASGGGGPGAFRINLLKQVLDSTLEQQAAIERILKGDPLPDAQHTGQRAAVPPGAAEAPVAALPGEPAEPWDVRSALREIHRQISAVAQGTYDLRKENGQLQEENEKLRAMQYGGLFNFVLDVEREDFLAFAVIMALGNPNVARKFLEAPQRTFYDRLDRWKTGTKSHREMLRWIEWRKAVGRKIKLRLPDPKDSGSPEGMAANPEVLHEVVAAIGESSSRNYPSLLREILSALLAQNPKNWESARRELVGLIEDELPQ